MEGERGRVRGMGWKDMRGESPEKQAKNDFRVLGLGADTMALHQIASFDAQVFIDQSLGQQIRRRIDQHDAGFAKGSSFV